MKKLFSTLFKLSLSLLFALVMVEAGLRLFPGLIPLDLLIHFHEKPRAEIASRVGLKTRGETILLERDDGGPELRIFKPFTTVVWPIEDDGTYSVVKMDRNGFCNPPGIDPPQVDIITLGDSFTWCHAVDPDQTWANQLSEMTDLSLYNLGIGGIGTFEYIQILKKFGVQRSPRLVIMNIYEGNDLRDLDRYYFHRLYHDDDPVQINVPPPPAPPSSPSDYLAEGYEFWREQLMPGYSYAYNLVRAAGEYISETDSTPSIVATGSEPNSDEKRKENFRYRLVFDDDVPVPFNPDNADVDEAEYARRLYEQEIRFEVLDLLREPLREFVSLARRHEFIPVITYTPAAYTAYEAQVVFEDPSLGELMPWFSRQQRNFLEQQAAEIGYIFVDLTPALQAAAQARGGNELLYYRYDLHLTPAGHTVVAEAINRAMQELDLLE